MTDKVKITLWIPKETKEKLKQVAKERRWSMSLLNEILIERYLKTRKI